MSWTYIEQNCPLKFPLFCRFLKLYNANMASSFVSTGVPAYGHPIQVVARRTGLSTDVIRVWERRYGAVTPVRSAASRRLYSDADIERLRLLRLATETGWRISDVARLSTEELARLTCGSEPSWSRVDDGDSVHRHYLERCCEAMAAMDENALGIALSEAEVNVGVPLLLEKILTPLLERIGEEWATGTTRICQEHMATTLVRHLLDNIRTTNRNVGGPGLVVATPIGQRHELGALMATVTAGFEGYRTTYLGPDLPAAEIAFAAIQTGSRVVALGISHPADDPGVHDELRRLRRHLPEGTVLIAGGAAASGYSETLREIKAQRLASLGELRAELRQLRTGVGTAGSGACPTLDKGLATSEESSMAEEDPGTTRPADGNPMGHPGDNPGGSPGGIPGGTPGGRPAGSPGSAPPPKPAGPDETR